MFAKELKIDTFMVETSAINIVLAINEAEDPAVESPVLEDINDLLAILQNPQVALVRRSAIQVAHLLAQFGFNSNFPHVCNVVTVDRNY